jgi:hypothetical protein
MKTNYSRTWPVRHELRALDKSTTFASVRGRWVAAEEYEWAVAEIAEYRRIRALLVRALMRATGASQEAVEEGPVGVAARHLKEMEGEREALRAELAACREAFVKFGNHTDSCEWYGHQRFDTPAQCSCGFIAARKGDEGVWRV